MFRNVVAAILLLAWGSAEAYSLAPAVRVQVDGLDSEPSAVAIGDVDGDGRDDLVLNVSRAGRVPHQVLVFLQQANGSLAPPLEATVPPGHESRIVIADLEDDGKAEVIVGHHSGISVLRVESGSLVETSRDSPTFGSARHLAVLDIDRDGHLDVFVVGLAYAWYDSEATAWFGDGQGGFGRVVTIATPFYEVFSEMVAVDLDRDGHLDIVARAGQDREANAVHLLHNDGSDDFAPPVSISLVDAWTWGGGTSVATGDFNGDGMVDIASKSHATDVHHVAVLLQDTVGQFGATTPLASTGAPAALLGEDMEGDGRDDLVLLEASGTVNVWLQREGVLVKQMASPPAVVVTAASQFDLATGDLDGDACMDVVVADVVGGFTLRSGTGCSPVVNDFDGDGGSDVVWRHAGAGSNAIWSGADPRARLHVRAVRNTDWEIVATGDFDGDAVSDLFWRNRDTGANAIWPAAAPGSTPVKGVTRTEWRVVGAGDFDGDRRDDLFWRNDATGANAIWPSGHPGDVATQGVRNPAWRVVGVGDFDGDRQADVLWRNTSDGRNVIWRSGDYQDQQAVGVASTEWTVAGVGDFDADGVDDILWRNTATGANAIWRRADARSRLPVTNVSNLEWQVAAIGDYDADGASDILWRNARTGANVIWMNADYGDQFAVDRVRDMDWQVVPRR